MLHLFTYFVNNLLPMNFIGSLLDVAVVAVAVGTMLKRQAEQAALETQPVPVPVRSRR